MLLHFMHLTWQCQRTSLICFYCSSCYEFGCCSFRSHAKGNQITEWEGTFFNRLQLQHLTLDTFCQDPHINCLQGEKLNSFYTNTDVNVTTKQELKSQYKAAKSNTWQWYCTTFTNWLSISKLNVPGQDLQGFEGSIWQAAHLFHIFQSKMWFTTGLGWAS